MASVHTNSVTSPWVKQMTSFSGTDINLVVGNMLLGNGGGVSYSITREKAPIFTLGSPSAQSYARGKRGIAGSLSMTVFDRSGFYDIMSRSAYASKKWDITGGGENYEFTNDQWLSTSTGNVLTEPANTTTNPELTFTADGYTTGIAGGTGLELRAPGYADQLPPFDLSITGRNEVGTAASMVIYGLEIVNEGTTQGINDIGFEAQYTFIARDVVGWTPTIGGGPGTSAVATEFQTLRTTDLGIGR